MEFMLNESKGGFPIEIETQISNLITCIYIIIYIIKIAKLYVISLLILFSILIGSPTKEFDFEF